ncbi:hypothetical protein KXW23_005361, partial [Aspergillus fumigatus]
AAAPSPYACSTTQTYASYHQPTQAPAADSNEHFATFTGIQGSSWVLQGTHPDRLGDGGSGPSVCQRAECFVHGAADMRLRRNGGATLL